MYQRFYIGFQIIGLIFTLTLNTAQGQNHASTTTNTVQNDSSNTKATTTPKVQAANKNEPDVAALIERAEGHYKLGLAAMEANNIAQSRAQFDAAVDELLKAGIDLKTDARLQSYYHELVEKIVNQQSALKSKDGNNQQTFQGSPASEVANLTESDLNKLATKAAAHPAPKESDYTFKAELEPAVNQFINYFTTGRGRHTIETGFSRAGKYRKLAEDIFAQEGVPKDLIWLAQVESVWQPSASSQAAARGIWQFIPSTGSRFGLRQDGWCDERLDPEKSTLAAARYLRFLGDRYAGDWLLAMAAYNYGENGVDRAIDRCGYADFWVLRNQSYLPQETKNYVPAILAVIAISKHPENYGLTIDNQTDWQFEKITVNGRASLRTVATALKVPYNTLTNYNPQLITGYTPPEGYTLRVPIGAVNEEAINTMQSLPRENYHIRNVVKRTVTRRSVIRRRR